ncbi:MAG: sugar kinase [Planctomycetaceae bacterium]|nr:sugar kinase [Planctomycetaceae bacterium]MCB9949503.1 sugar kinase [Planctomycetaceae bacterium]
MNETTNRKCVLTFGELLMRLDAPPPQRFAQSSSFNMTFTGGEANVAVALSQWGVPTRLLSKVPAHALGEACLNQFRRYGVETQHVVRNGERLGILFVESGAGPRSPQVIYDRNHSAFRSLTPDEIDWDAAFDGVEWFHFTGTAPALGDSVRATLQVAVSIAQQRQIPISFDCSYRAALWSIEEARVHFQPLLQQVDVFLGSESDAATFFDIDEQGDACFRALRDKFNLNCIAFTERRTAANGDQEYCGRVLLRDELASANWHRLHVVDRIGAGDAFAAGIIRGLLSGHPLSDTVPFATSAAVLAHTIPGDFLLATVDEIHAYSAHGPATRGWR